MKKTIDSVYNTLLLGKGLFLHVGEGAFRLEAWINHISRRYLADKLSVTNIDQVLVVDNNWDRHLKVHSEAW